MPDRSSPQSVEATPLPPLNQKATAYLNLDFPRGRCQPTAGRFLVAALVSIAASLAACAVIVAVGTALFPSTSGYDHFRFMDYAKLTVPGVTAASLAWPTVTLLSSQARRPFAWLTVIVTLGGLSPDAWILYKGAPPEAVVILVVMHLALAAVTYPALVHIAPQRRGPIPPNSPASPDT
ncbi:DUF6069 family protein [Arthrobacter sp. SDTb3-6]|uniref:DUF6069 family protein n=1 Tax=Arthrobacter sp. SDTb3-6 TaxID=2713571 RepID=UPI00159EA1D8|nr:DUF6069 family protein [Arthrobacter sp. SDTb3-6]NVN00520.1 hypothetical protein [Arthrobacter sp. SDTb3-6]